MICKESNVQCCLPRQILQKRQFKRGILVIVTRVKLESPSADTEQFLSDRVNRLCVFLPGAGLSSNCQLVQDGFCFWENVKTKLDLLGSVDIVEIEQGVI